MRKAEEMITPAELPITVYHRTYTLEAPAEEGPIKLSPRQWGTLCGLVFQQHVPEPVEGAPEAVCTACRYDSLDQHGQPTGQMKAVGHTRGEVRALTLESR